jgi:ADP-dependent NAD(P)H-hydrate dehydratase / NAD(P)H-hydrate epimerase
MRLFTADETRTLDKTAIEVGIPAFSLMELAGAGAAAEIKARWPVAGRQVLIACGPGNNGGDGYVVARHLSNAGAFVQVLRIGPKKKSSPEAALNLKILHNLAVPVFDVPDFEVLGHLVPWFDEADLLVDALFGVGLDRAPEGLFAEVIRLFNESPGQRVALDLPSGLDADRGHPFGDTVRADLTVTFGAPKIGLYTSPGFEWCGETVVVDISWPAAAVPEAPGVFLLEDAQVAACRPHRRPTAHKGTFGHTLIWAGSPGKAGAAILASEAALSMGSGLVTTLCDEALLPVLMQRFTEIMCEALPAAGSPGAVLDALLAACEGRAVLALGPGLPVDDATAKVVLELVRRCPIPLVIDASALTLLARKPEVLKKAKSPVVITPHPGEFSRLTGLDTAELQRDRLRLAREFAARHGVVVVLKGARTVVAAPDGSAAINPTGNPGMATGGAGDVLTGYVASLIGQGLPPMEAACVGAFLHGRAGDLAVQERGEPLLRAGDLITALPAALNSLSGQHES